MTDVKYCPECGAEPKKVKVELDKHQNPDYDWYDRRYVVACWNCGWKGDIKGEDDKDVTPVKWPVDTMFYLHMDKDSASYAVGEALEDAGMTQEEIEQWEKKRDYAHLYVLYEVGFKVRLHEDGRTEILGTDLD